MGQQDRQFGAQMGLNYDQFINAFNQQNAQFGATNRLAYDQMNQQDRQFGANYDYQQSQADMQNLMALLGYGQQMDQYNNSLLGMDQNRAMALFGLIPGLTPTQVDVTGPMNSCMQAQQAAYGEPAGQAANGLFGALGTFGSAAMNAGGWGGLLSDTRQDGRPKLGLWITACLSTPTATFGVARCRLASWRRTLRRSNRSRHRVPAVSRQLTTRRRYANGLPLWFRRSRARKQRNQGFGGFNMPRPMGGGIMGGQQPSSRPCSSSATCRVQG